ncbi:MAG: CAP domain-containing protein [Candidatus Saccharimonadales bacterium]
MKKHKYSRSTVHPHHLHSFRAILFGVLLVAVALIKFDGAKLPRVAEKKTDEQSAVLAYATSMSRGALLAENNASRAANGLGGLNLNSQLNNSAQAKAQHMADNNYWAHVAPDGTQPWYFFEAAGYSYSNAGENLAYGFDSSYAVNQGWMNSAGHRANILGNYVDVGYGIVNTPNFQGGEYTIVVAHYATPYNYSPPAPKPAPTPSPAPAPTPAPTAPSSSKPTQQTPSSPVTQPADQTPTETTPQTPASETTAPQNTQASEKSIHSTSQPKPVAVANAHNVSVLEMLKMGTLPGVAVASLVLTVMAAACYALTHRALMKHALVTSERFVIAHPTFDIIVLILSLTLILTTTAARLQ